MGKYTPMIEQYLTIKAQYKDAFLFFRLGDFYELFFEDAIKAAKELEITLTSRASNGDEKISMCGVPYHAAENYINLLIKKGYKVAICEQVEDPKQAKGVVKREVVQLITPGTVMNGNMLAANENNYIATVSQFPDHRFGIGFIDLSTGEGRVTLIQGEWSDVLAEINTAKAKEVVISSGLETQWLRTFDQLTASHEDETTIPNDFEPLTAHLNDVKLKETIGRLITYLQRTQRRTLDHLQPISFYQLDTHMKIDMHSKRNLELVETIRGTGRKGSLLWLLDQTVTPMGGRLLKKWVERPLLDQTVIENRLNMVETLLQQYFEREALKDLLKDVYDLERLAGKISFGTAHAKDLIQLKQSLQQVPAIQNLVSKLADDYGDKIFQSLDPCAELADLLARGIMDDPPLSVKEGGMIAEGYHHQLDQYRDASRNGKQWIAELEQTERKRTGIKSLKIGFNKVFGYYIEVTRANLHLLVDDRYERKQTLANAERYITAELKEKELLILEAEEKIVELEYHLFTEIRETAKSFMTRLQSLAKGLSELDVLISFSLISEQYHYVRPQFSHSRVLDIQEGRHPVVEKVMDTNGYVANDCVMGEDREILLITGPNMSGKSTYMRQLALTAIMAQIGCFVPATAATLPLFDQIFTRIGAADDLVSGQSTFMVEMNEAKHAVTKATKNSLILLDEIGRGTSTYDGMAIAQAIIEYIHDEIGAKTLFSTHYHELTSLETSLSALQNVHVEAVEEQGKIIFLHKVIQGFADKSYGIHVAKLAQLPDKLIERAQHILQALEEGAPSSNKSAEIKEPEQQLSLFATNETGGKRKKQPGQKERQVLETLNRLPILDMTPLEAINQLYELQKMLKK